MILEQFSLNDRVAVVTGGGQGLGKVFCEAFADVGATVVIAELNEETGQVTADELAAKGARSLFVQTDVTQASSVNAMVETVIAEYGQLDVLMNNAGIVHWEPAEDVSEADWRKVFEVNLNGLFFCCQAAARHMIPRRTGSLINISSMSALIVNRPQQQASYNASKAAVSHLTASLATEWAPHGIRVNAIAPGYMGTDMARPFFEDPQYGPVWLPNIPLGRPGRPEELGPLAVYLASDASSYMTGTTVVIDGGYCCW